MNKKITVTTSDIRNGQPSKGYECPVSLAFQRIFKTANVCVTDTADVNINGQWQEIHLPGKALDFIMKFDAGRRVRPFSFTIQYALPKRARLVRPYEFKVKAGAGAIKASADIWQLPAGLCRHALIATPTVEYVVARKKIQKAGR